MIVNTTLSQDAEYLGDIQEHRVGIDKSNIDFIATLLTSNLYSRPLESFLRETVANAYDSHVEAGTPEHILLLIEDVSYCTYRFSIRDYGVGVSPERFEAIYKYIGSSTKRQSNDYIGMFGIGRFSCLSCADTAHITSYYNNVKYSYVMYKNGGGINIDKISETEGEFKNGLEVSVEKNVLSVHDVITALNKLCLFDKLYISYKGDNYRLRHAVDSFNERKLTHYKTFSRCSLLFNHHNYFRVGNVLYDNNEPGLCTVDGIIVNLPIGTVDITPNREELQYTDYTRTEIASRFLSVKEEFQEIINSLIAGNMTLREYADAVVLNNCFRVRESGDHDNDFLSINMSDVSLDESRLTIDGEALPKEYSHFLNDVKYLGISKDFVYKSIYKLGYSRSFSTEIKYLLAGKYDIIQKADNITKQVTFFYHTSSIQRNTVILVQDGLNKWKNAIIEYLKAGDSHAFNVEECIDFTFKHLPIATMANSNVPEWYIKTYKETQKAKRKKADSDKIPIRLYGKYGYSQSYLSNLPSDGLVIYSAHVANSEDKPLRDLGGYLLQLHSIAAVITIKSEYIKLLEQDRRFLKLENFLYIKNKSLSKLATAQKILRKFHSVQLTGFSHISLGAIPIYMEFTKKYEAEITCIRYANTNSTIADIMQYYEEKGWLNPYDLSYFSLSEKDVEALHGWNDLISRKSELIQALAFRKYGRLPKIGLSPVKAPKLI